ncbi:hypothetical protein NUH30_03560 [Leptospira sp. 85282-16]|uniref:30S ribosomal protein S1 n=1 Tax=Leptospira montravelensis TaxID=2484961 RepID=A0ABY2LUP8_9LEPT|nr:MULTISPECIES: hypothetical protein [Leptospira]MCT8332739.1 hypothetical protein [Leptospira sp. 85282-16]TGK83935.1 30S ribosomal protein S1 [Leptospira montravelensis]TGL05942.1 30S ribosomal protein S1 [Leptospira montravelensis]
MKSTTLQTLTTLIIYFLGISSISIYPAELRFPNGEVFHSEFVYEDERLLVVRFKGSEYKVPKKDLEYYNLVNNGQINNSYKIAILSLKNGSVIKGTIADKNKDEVIIKSELGFLTINRSEIKNTVSEADESPEFPIVYLANDKLDNQTRVGGSFTYLPLFPPLGNQTPPLFGLSVFTEPAFLRFKNTYQLGFKFEYLQSTGPLKEVITQSGYVYLHQSKVFQSNPLFDFYGIVGIGTSSVTYRFDQNNAKTGTNPSAYIELGWQGLKYGPSFYRIGWKNLCFFEIEKTHCGTGLELSGGVNF